MDGLDQGRGRPTGLCLRQELLERGPRPGDDGRQLPLGGGDRSECATDAPASSTSTPPPAGSRKLSLAGGTRQQGRGMDNRAVASLNVGSVQARDPVMHRAAPLSRKKAIIIPQKNPASSQRRRGWLSRHKVSLIAVGQPGSQHVPCDSNPTPLQTHLSLQNSCRYFGHERFGFALQGPKAGPRVGTFNVKESSASSSSAAPWICHRSQLCGADKEDDADLVPLSVAS